MINDRNYDDIIYLPHHVSKTHKQMSIIDRAAQYSPVAALTGYDDTIKETSRKTEKKIILSDNQIAILNEKLLILNECKIQPLVTIIYFKKDKRKEGGKYLKIDGKIKRFDDVNKTIILVDRTIISINDLFDIKSDLFASFDFE